MLLLMLLLLILDSLRRRTDTTICHVVACRTILGRSMVAQLDVRIWDGRKRRRKRRRKRGRGCGRRHDWMHHLVEENELVGGFLHGTSRWT